MNMLISSFYELFLWIVQLNSFAYFEMWFIISFKNLRKTFKKDGRPRVNYLENFFFQTIKKNMFDEHWMYELALHWHKPIDDRYGDLLQNYPGFNIGNV